MLPVHAGHLLCGQRALEQFCGEDGGGTAIGVRVLAKGDEAVGVIGHALREIGVRVEDAEDGHGADALSQAREDLAFHIGQRLRNHGAVQDEIDRIDMCWDARIQLLPERFNDFILDDGAW